MFVFSVSGSQYLLGVGGREGKKEEEKGGWRERKGEDGGGRREGEGGKIDKSLLKRASEELG